MVLCTSKCWALCSPSGVHVWGWDPWLQHDHCVELCLPMDVALNDFPWEVIQYFNGPGSSSLVPPPSYPFALPPPTLPNKSQGLFDGVMLAGSVGIKAGSCWALASPCIAGTPREKGQWVEGGHGGRHLPSLPGCLNRYGLQRFMCLNICPIGSCTISCTLVLHVNKVQ